jgi:hypothetical protein
MPKARVEYRDIRALPDDEKAKVYEQVDAKYLEGKEAKTAAHKSGFPAITIDCDDIHVIADILSLEQWWSKKKAGLSAKITREGEGNGEGDY